MSYKLIVKDAFRQILGRILSAVGGFIVIKIITPYLGPERYGDYSTLLKYFAIWSAFADLGLYVVALRQLGEIQEKFPDNKELLATTYSKFITTRITLILQVYGLALLIAYFISAYTSNPYILRGLPLGMMFSASFMLAGFLQIPIQLYWKMEYLSIALFLARIVQIVVLIIIVYFLFPMINFKIITTNSLISFELIQFSLVISGITQALYVYFIGQKYLKFSFIYDHKFACDMIKSNFQYGVAYYLSSFHTLIVLILLSNFFPTIQGFTYVGIRAMALQLMEILLIVPSSLGNSLIHKISKHDLPAKLKSFGYLQLFVVWIGSVVFLNCWIFAGEIINFLGGKEYMTYGNNIGSDYLLPFLMIVLILSFIKQIFNYLFVATHMQNKLLYINLFGVLIGLSIGGPLIYYYNLLGGLVTQILMEVLFVLGAFWIAYKYKVLPHFPIVDYQKIFSILIIFGIVGKILLNTNNIYQFIINSNYYKLFIGYTSHKLGYYLMISSHDIFILLALIFNLILVYIYYKPIKQIVKQIS